MSVSYACCTSCHLDAVTPSNLRGCCAGVVQREQHESLASIALALAAALRAVPAAFRQHVGALDAFFAALVSSSSRVTRKPARPCLRVLRPAATGRRRRRRLVRACAAPAARGARRAGCRVPGTGRPRPGGGGKVRSLVVHCSRESSALDSRTAPRLWLIRARMSSRVGWVCDSQVGTVLQCHHGPHQLRPGRVSLPREESVTNRALSCSILSSSATWNANSRCAAPICAGVHCNRTSQRLARYGARQRGLPRPRRCSRRWSDC